MLIGTVVEMASKWWPRADLQVYVDDLAIAATAARDDAAIIVADVVNFVIRRFEIRL